MAANDVQAGTLITVIAQRMLIVLWLATSSIGDKFCLKSSKGAVATMGNLLNRQLADSLIRGVTVQ